MISPEEVFIVIFLMPEKVLLTSWALAVSAAATKAKRRIDLFMVGEV
jgi:hypothetical protein